MPSATASSSIAASRANVPVAIPGARIGQGELLFISTNR